MIQMTSLKDVPEDKSAARLKPSQHSAVLRTALHKTNKLKSKIKNKVVPNIGK